MSLLIDALKQAEAARAQTQGEASDSTNRGIELEPMMAEESAPVATLSTQESQAPTPARAMRASRPAPSSSGTRASVAARELFEVKRQTPSRLPLILAGAGILVFLCGAAYVWWAIQPHGGLLAPPANANVQPLNTQAALPPRGAAEPTPVSASNALAASVQATQPAGAASHSSSAPSQEANTMTVRRERHAPVHPATSAADTSVAIEPKPTRTNAATNSDTSTIQSAYTAFQEGNYSLARQRYQDVLRQDPRNVDAMNALGLIAWRGGEPDVAERMFRAAVNADPKDATAISQLSLLYAESDPSGSEARLRNLIASQPNAASAYYALGNLMSRQQRWNEAQQALFQAYTLDSDNPDVLFNLAVSLEHLNQPSVARQFYERALQGAARRPADFDRNVARSRVQALGSR